MRRNNFKNLPARILITALGVAFILWGISTLALGFFGKKATALITDIRREGGERNETIRGQYTYIISYAFHLPDGKRISGYTRKTGGAAYLKADGKSTTQVRYFSFFPVINTQENETKPGIGQLILAAIGCFLIFIMNKPASR